MRKQTNPAIPALSIYFSVDRRPGARKASAQDPTPLGNAKKKPEIYWTQKYGGSSPHLRGMVFVATLELLAEAVGGNVCRLFFLHERVIPGLPDNPSDLLLERGASRQ